MIYHGDCLDVMAAFEPSSVDAIVTDPPYGLGEPRSGSDQVSGRCFAPRSAEAKARRSGGFMGKAWDGTGVAFDPATWAAAYRVAKPSSYLLAFGGTRTVHRMACAIEDAGWIIRDMLVWGYASGFPKSKASLKPAWEPIVMARKPGPLRMLNIDECRIGTEEVVSLKGLGANVLLNDDGWKGVGERPEPTTSLGRWPANIILTDPIFDGGVEGVVGGGEARTSGLYDKTGAAAGMFGLTSDASAQYDDSGTYSRFFLIPKAARSDREPVLGGLPLRKPPGWSSGEQSPGTFQSQPTPHRANHHPTVKPVDLMRHLVRLVTPPGGTVLDPFLGSGTTGLAAEMEGFDWIGIEKEAEYVAIAEARLNGTQRGMAL